MRKLPPEKGFNRSLGVLLTIWLYCKKIHLSDSAVISKRNWEIGCSTRTAMLTNISEGCTPLFASWGPQAALLKLEPRAGTLTGGAEPHNNPPWSAGTLCLKASCFGPLVLSAAPPSLGPLQPLWRSPPLEAQSCPTARSSGANQPPWAHSKLLPRL